MSQTLRLRLFGGFQLETSDGQLITINLRKAEALLAYLAVVPGQRASRETLATLLWGEFEQHRARQSLRQTLLALTKALAKGDVQVLRMESQTVSLIPNSLQVDVVEMVQLLEEGTADSLVSAASLYQGELVAGLAVDAPDFEDWLTVTRGRLHDRAVKALTELLNDQILRGKTDAAIDTANQALRIDSYREDIHRQLMELYLEKGMRSSALAQFRACRDILDRELGVRPDEQTLRLYRSILEQGGSDQSVLPSLPVARGDSPVGPAGGGANESASISWGESPVGRDQELGILETLYDDAASGRGRAVAIVGETGIGKSYLIKSFLDSYRQQDVGVVEMTGRQADQGLYLAAWKEALKSANPTMAELGEQDQRWDKKAVQSFLAGQWQGEGPEDDRDRQRLFDAVVSLLESLTQGSPLIVQFDDLHWADNESVRLLSYCVRQLTAAPVLFVLSLRSEEGTANALVGDLLDDLAGQGRLVWLTLKPLTQLECAEFVRQIETKFELKEEAHREVDQIWALSEGNPQIILEYAVPQSAREARRELFGALLPRRLITDAQHIRSSLSEVARNLLSAACVLGPRSNYEVLMGAAGLDEDGAAQGIEELVGRQILSVEGDDVVFVHLRVCRTLYEDLVPPRRRLLHAACTRVMERVYQDTIELQYQSLAYHAREGGLYLKALSYQVRAADVEISRGAFGAASKMLRSGMKTAKLAGDEPAAMALTAKCQILLAQIEEAAQNQNRALGHLKSAEPLAQRSGQTALRVEVLLGQSRLAYRRGHTDEALDSARRALALCDEGPASGVVWTGPEQFLARLHLMAGYREQITDQLRARLARCRAIDLGTEVVESAIFLALTLAVQSKFDEARELCQAAVTRADTIGSERSMGSALFGTGQVLLWAGEVSDALDPLTRSLEIAEADGNLLRIYVVKAVNGQAYIANGKFEEGRSALGSAVELGGQLETRFLLAYFKALLAEDWPESEDDSAGRAAAEEALTLSNETNQPWARSIALRASAIGLARHRARHLSDAEQVIARAIAIQTGLELSFEVARSLTVHAKIARARGDTERALIFYRRAGQLYHDMGRHDEAERIETLADALRPSSAARG